MESNRIKEQQNESLPSKWYVLALLTIVSTFAHLDKNLIIILQESIKADLGLSDTQLGLISGVAFAIAYATFGIPVALLSDRFSRRNIIAAALAMWSGITALTGLGTNFIQLFLARFGVGIGETGSTSPIISMISDYFGKANRGRAYAIYSMGVYFGLMLGFLLGGYLNEAIGWRSAFMIVGIPGVIFAMIFYFTVKEPIRGRLDNREQEDKAKAPSSFLTILRFMAAKKTLVYLLIGATLHTLVGTAFANWMPPFFSRVHGLGSAEIGLWLAFAIGVCGAAGTYLGGYLGDLHGKKDIRWNFWIPMMSIVASLPFALGTLYSENHTVALVFYMMPNLLYAFFLGPSYAMLQEMVEIKMRATAAAVFSISLIFLGSGLGPLLVGLLSDYFEPTMGTGSIRMAMVIIAILEIPAFLCFMMAARTLKKDLIS